jgi:hypothetical protein
MLKKKTRLKLVNIILIALFILPHFIFPLLNNITLSRFSKQLYEIELTDTKVIEKHATCGKLDGSGRGMDFFACVLVETDLTYQDLKAELSSQELKYAKPEGKLQYGGVRNESGIIDIDIVKVDSEKLDTEHIRQGNISFESLKNNGDYGKYYALIIYDGSYSADFDIRGY